MSSLWISRNPHGSPSKAGSHQRKAESRVSAPVNAGNGITAAGAGHLARALNVHRDADGTLVWNSGLTSLSLAGAASRF